MVNILVLHLVQYPIVRGEQHPIILMTPIASNIALNIQHTHMIVITKG